MLILFFHPVIILFLNLDNGEDMWQDQIDISTNQALTPFWPFRRITIVRLSKKIQ